MAMWKAGLLSVHPEDLLGALREFAEKQAESVQDAQKEQYATLTLNTAVELTAAALSRIQVDGPSDAQALAPATCVCCSPRRSRSSPRLAKFMRS